MIVVAVVVRVVLQVEVRILLKPSMLIQVDLFK
jgi:hypothetical protein